ncbi:MAG: hypothetical protein GY906_24785 [bacterium]|nr:hypothetical protein [bacterium]
MANSRRVMANIPRLTRRPWEDVSRDLEEYLRKSKEAWSDGLPPGFNNLNPTVIAPDTVSSPGTEATGWAASDHAHFVAVATAVDLGAATSEGVASFLARSDHVHKRDLLFRVNDVDIGVRGAGNFVDTASFSWAGTDDAGSDEVEIRGTVLAAGIDHGGLGGLGDDDHLQYFLLAGRTGGQSAFGGTSGGGDLFLQGRDHASLGLIRVNSPMVFGPYEPSGEAYAFLYDATESFPGNFIGGGLNMSGDLTFNTSVFIYESFRGAPTITAAANPGFAAYTVLQALPQLVAGPGAGNNPLQALILNAGATIRQPFSGTRTVAAVAAINFASTLNGAANGAVLNCTNWTGMTVQPNWNTVSGSTINFGAIRGVWCRNPGQALFGQSLGTERLGSYVGLEVDDITLNNAGGNAVRVAVRSAINDGTNKFFLVNNGTANSLFANSDALFYDAGAVVFGTGQDVRLEWDGTAGLLDFNPAVGEDLFFAFGVVSGKPTYLFEAESFGVSETNYTQIRFGFDRYAFGQTGVIGNQVGLFVAPNRTADVAGGWSDYLLTQGGNLNIGTFAMSDVAAWTINQISLDNTAGSIASLDTLVIGGMTTSNPGITVTERAALRVTGRFKQRGSIQYPPINPSALSAGDNDDWAGLLTGSPNNNGRYWARVSGNATTSTITGIDATAVQDGDTFELTNVGTENLLVENEGTGSVAANRIITGQGGSIAPNFVLGADRSMTLRYDGTSSRWRVTTPPGAVAPLSGHWKFDNSTTMADPGSGDFRNNNATLASVTSIAISDISFRGGDASNIISALASGDQLYLQNQSDGAEFMVFDITAVTDNGTWFQIDGTAGDVGNAFSNNAEFNILFIFA